MTKKQNNLENEVQKGKIILGPKLELIELKKTAIHVPTQKRYDGLMQVYEIGERKWASGALPTDKKYFWDYGEKTCIGEGDNLEFGTKDFYEKERFRIIPDTEFYKIQGIPEEDLIKLNEYFERTKPNRASKG